MEYLLPVVIQRPNKKYLALKVVDMSVQEYDMNRYDYAKMD